MQFISQLRKRVRPRLRARFREFLLPVLDFSCVCLCTFPLQSFGISFPRHPNSLLMIKFYPSKTWFVVLLLVASFHAFSQTRITGKVTSSDDGTALPGVSILEKGTTNCTVTDVDGNYSINASENSILVFSFVGFTTQEVSAYGKTTIDVTLGGDVTALNEVVVIGYGELQRKDVTGSIVAINTKDFNRGVIASPQHLLVGKVAGAL